jgi:hypothetical protein
MRDISRTALALLLLALTVAHSAAGAWLINAQQADFRSRPEFIRDHFAHIETLPFDGLVVSTRAGSRVMSGAPLSPDEIAREFSPLNGLAFTRMQHRFAWVNVDRPADFFGDWSPTAANFRAFAKALKAHGLRGIFLDNEEYAQPLFNYPDNCDDLSRSLEEYQAQAQRCGREIAEAICAEFPDIVIVALHGPYSSHPGTPDPVRAGQTHWESEELRGAFTVGLMEGLDTRARLIDGGELYAYRTASDFDASYVYRKHTLPSAGENCAFIPDALRGVWARKLGIAFGLHNLPFPAGAVMDPPSLRAALAHALRRCDDYVWLYFEEENWNAPGEVSAKWVEAVLEARAAVSAPPSVVQPFVSLTSPAAGSTFHAPASLLLRASAAPADAIAKIEFFAGAVKIAEADAVTGSASWLLPAAGSYLITARATDHGGGTTTSSAVPVTITASFSAGINFQPSGITPVPGYFADTGLMFANRGDGLAFGWNTPHSANMRHRPAVADLRGATLCQAREGGVWEIALPNGAYQVAVMVGDGSFPSTHTVNVEGVAFWNSEATGAGEFRSRTRTVVVADGRLTLDVGAAAHEQTRLCCLTIAASGAVPAAPGGFAATALEDGTVELRWHDRSSNETDFVIERSENADFSGALEIAAPAAETVQSIDAMVLPGRRYHYRLRARNAAGDSAPAATTDVVMPLADLDADRVPDAQEMAPCIVGINDSLVDTDGDGWSNASEAIAGTDPLHCQSFLRFDSLGRIDREAGGMALALRFSTVPLRRYFIDYSETLATGAWLYLHGSERIGDGTVQAAEDIAGSGARFYRLRAWR